ncbi:MAG: molecular chaperone DnaJ [Rhodospirillaceae bacterium]|nr:molecular chaperone DnaJ [Rhodospirillaceae bacterium]|tara:strand:+ start:2767 stop:3321 length:555 start_codon:yes stop_codon:yes gene_type:complete
MVYDPRKTLKNSEKSQLCDHVNCNKVAEHRAPKSRENLREYYWFCLEHVREYNKSWNYFEDMSEEQISTYRHNSATWHRPTWDLGNKNQNSQFKIKEPYGLFNGETDNNTERSNSRRTTTTAPVAKALNVMSLKPSASPTEVKDRYKQLAKKFHPDLNSGSKDAEERLKRVNEAYSLLVSSGYV